MRLTKTILRSAARRALCLALLLSALAFNASKADAQIDAGTYINFGSSVGVARGQVARLTVVWTRVSPPDPCLPPGPCKTYGPFNTTLALVDAGGRVVARQSFALTQGRPAALNFAPSEFGAGGRAQLRAQITVDRDANGLIPCIMPSLEVVNLDGSNSTVVNPGTLVGFNPQPEPPGDREPDAEFEFGFVTEGRGQTMRLNATFTDADTELPPGPCRVTLSFYDGDGRLVMQTVETVELGQTVSLDVPAGEIPATVRKRLRATVRVEALPGGLVPCIMPSLEVFNADTGKTSLFYPGAMIGE
ncbi:MAG TPA: hypothetical protein VGP08_10075 [Pyrinomonadaceae bacterium]|jgi:hypothetical protein|nr:hypothetical protein [Pyrinomonadaceae bacterium]